MKKYLTKKYLINYYFETWGKIEVEAENKDKAKKMLFKGEFERGEEWGQLYAIKDIKIIKED